MGGYAAYVWPAYAPPGARWSGCVAHLRALRSTAAAWRSLAALTAGAPAEARRGMTRKRRRLLLLVVAAAAARQRRGAGR